MKILNFLKNKFKIIIISLIVVISAFAIVGAGYHFIPQYFEAKQEERDSSRKCKSYRALAEIAYGIYKADPEGTEWQEKFEEAQKRQAQHKCTTVISISQ
jgi:anionic cell wall polymer biosynthesis LytR-Cps2A-Psr (LCP) family protein